MPRLLFLTGLFALAFAAPATAQREALLPGVTYERQVQLTAAGPVVLHIVIGPRPGGPYALRPVLSNDTILGREQVTSMQHRLSSTATMVGVNGDLFDPATGRPSGLLMQDAALVSPSAGDRSSIGVTTDGTLDVRRVAFFGSWRGTGESRVLNDLNEEPGQDEISLFTSAWGPTTPNVPDAAAAVLFPFPAATPNVDLSATAVEVRDGSAVPIPPGGAVLVARGAAAEALRSEVGAGATVGLRLLLRPAWDGVVQAVGGGPLIVRDGKPVFRANEAFLTTQLGPRNPRTAVGQLPDGRVVFVVTDGRQPGYSVGLTNWGLAQALVRLGVVTAAALDAGGSSTLAFDGTLLNRPSDAGGERAVSEGLMLAYTGVYLPPVAPSVSPNGDGVDDRQVLLVKVVRPSAVAVTLRAPNGATSTETIDHPAGTFEVPFPPRAPSANDVSAASLPRAGSAAPPRVPDGRWRFSVQATDDLAQTSSMTRAFTVNTTLGFLRTSRARLFLPPAGRELRLQWRQARSARVVVTIETSLGDVVRTLARTRYEPGLRVLRWDGLGRDRTAVRGGRYVVRVLARNELGATELVRPFTVQRIVGHVTH